MNKFQAENAERTRKAAEEFQEMMVRDEIDIFIFGNLYFLLFVQQNTLLKHWWKHWKIIVNTQDKYQTKCDHYKNMAHLKKKGQPEYLRAWSPPLLPFQPRAMVEAW